MFRRILLLLLFGTVPAMAQTDAIQGFATRGGQFVSVSGIPSTNRFQNVIPSATIAVYITGTTNLATIYKDSVSTPLSNPFTADTITSLTPGHWLFYAADAVGYDVVGSAGIAPNTFPAPVTLCTDCKGGGGGGGGGGSGTVFNVGCNNLSPLFNCNVTTPTTNAELGFSAIPFADMSVIGNFSGSTAGPQITRLIAGSNINFAEGGGGSTFTISTAGQPQIQVNDSATGVSQAIVDFNSTLPAAPSGNINVTWQNDTAKGRKSAYIPASLPPALAPVITPPVAGRFVVLNATACTATDANIRTVSACYADPAGVRTASGAIGQQQANSGFPPATGTLTFSGYTLPDGISAGSVTAVYCAAVSSNSGFSQPFTSRNCNTSDLILPSGSGIWPQQQVTVLTGLAGSGIATLAFNIQMVNSGPQGAGANLSVSAPVVIAYYTGSPVTSPSNLNVASPLTYSSLTNTLGLDPSFPPYEVAVPLSTAVGSLVQRWIVSDCTTTSGVCTGGGTNREWVDWDGTNWNIVASGGGGSVTWPASADIVVSNSTNSPAGLAPVNGDCVVGSGGVWVAGSCAGTTASNVTVNGGATLPTANFNATTPAAGAGNQNLAFQTSTTNVSVEVPFGTNSVPGIMQADGASLSSAAGLISCATATTSQKGCMRPDGSTITIVGDVISAVGAAISGGASGQVAIFGSATTITSGINLGNTGSDIPQLSGGLLAASILPKATASTFGVIEPDNTSCTVSAGILSCSGGGGGGLPTATQPGQTYASVAAGTTGAVVPQIFYNQTGDTIGSIESECSSACTYIVTQPQTITLGSSHAMNSNVTLLFQSGGKWTINGAFTLSNIQVAQASTLTAHFAGTSTLGLSPTVTTVPIEWFGGVGDGNASANTGTDNTSASTAALTAMSGGDLFFQCNKQYRFAAAGPNITVNNVGLLGGCYGSSLIFTSSASATIVGINGVSSGSLINNNKVRNLVIQRAVTPTTGSIGLQVHFAGATIVSQNDIQDNAVGVDIQYTPANGVGIFESNAVDDGLAGVSCGAVAHIGFFAHGSSTGFQSLRGDGNLYINGCGASPSTTGFKTDGVVEDLTKWAHFETAGAGVCIDLTGTIGQDVHITDPICDANLSEGIIDTVVGNSVEIRGGWVTLSQAGATAGVDLNGAVGATVSDMQCFSLLDAPCFESRGGGGRNQIINNRCALGQFANNKGQCVLLSGTSNVEVTNNIVDGSAQSGFALPMIQLVNSSFDTVMGNNISDGTGVGISADASSNNNRYLNLNSVTTFTISDLGAGNQLASFSNPMTTLGDTIYGGTSGVATRLAGPTTNAHQFVFGAAPTGSAVAPAWLDLGTFLGANVTGTSPISATPSTLGTALSCPTCDTSGSLTTNSLPKATGAHALSNSLFTDDGTNGAYGGTGPLTVASLKTGSGATGCSPATGCVALGEASTAGTPTSGTDYCRADSTAHQWLCSNNGAAEAPLAVRLPSGSVTFTAGTGVTSVVCATSYTCTNSRGEFTLVGGTATTGTIATVNFSTTLGAAPFCTVSTNGNGGSSTTFFDLGHGLPSTSSFTVTSGITVIGATINIDYQCGQ